MTPTTLAMLAAIPRTDRAALQKAHDAAAEFHAAMSRAMMADMELDDPGGHDHHYWAVEYQDALGAAAVAMQRVPLRWLEILGVKP